MSVRSLRHLLDKHELRKRTAQMRDERRTDTIPRRRATDPYPRRREYDDDEPERTAEQAAGATGEPRRSNDQNSLRSRHR